MEKRSCLFMLHAIFIWFFSISVTRNAEASNFPITNAVFKPSSFSDYDPMIFDLVNQISVRNIAGVLYQIENVAERLMESDDVVLDGSIFLQNFINSMNDLYGKSVTISQIIQLTREFVSRLPMSNDEIENYYLGLSLIESQPFGFVNIENPGPLTLVRHHKRSNIWSWLSVATVTAGAVVVCIFCPEAAIPVIEGAVEIGKMIINDQK